MDAKMDARSITLQTPPTKADLIRLNIGGTSFLIDERLLVLTEPMNLILLARNQSLKNFKSHTSLVDTKEESASPELFFDRDGENFRVIWAYVQGNRSMLPLIPEWKLQLIRSDSDYFGFTKLVQDIDWILGDKGDNSYVATLRQNAPIFLDLGKAICQVDGHLKTLTPVIDVILYLWSKLEESNNLDIVLENLCQHQFIQRLVRSPQMPSMMNDETEQAKREKTKTAIGAVSGPIAQFITNRMLGNILNLPPAARQSKCLIVTLKAVSVIKYAVAATRSLSAKIQLYLA
jgi:hypothetical protein